MPLRIDEVKTEDLIRELSPDALRYFAHVELSDDWPSYENALSGKFVRLGEVILLGTTIPYGAIYRERRHSLLHLDILEHGFQRMDVDVVARIKATAPEDGEYLDRTWPLVDAGRSRIKVDENGQPVDLRLGGGSYDFGQAAEAVRQQTGEIAQNILGVEIAVVAEE